MAFSWNLDPTDPRSMGTCEGEQFRRKFWVRQLLLNCSAVDSERRKEVVRSIQERGIEMLPGLRASLGNPDPNVANLALDAVKLLVPEEIGVDLSAGLGNDEENYPLELGAAILARLQYPDLAVGDTLKEIDKLASAAEKFVSERLHAEEGAGSPSTALDVLFQLGEFWRAEGFQGNAEEFYDPQNTWLPDVLKRRMGIPISLSVVFIALCKRFGLTAEGVGLPYHFIVRIAVPSDDSQGFVFVDPFQGARPLDLDDCRKLAESSGGTFDPEEHLKAIPPREIFVRMCNNLLAVYDNSGRYMAAERVATVLLHLSPANPIPYLIRAERRLRRGESRLARRDLMLVLGMEHDIGPIKQAAEQMLERIDLGYAL